MIKNCPICKKEFYTSHQRVICCSKKCSNLRMRGERYSIKTEFKKGTKVRLGREHTEKTKEKIRKKAMGRKGYWLGKKRPSFSKKWKEKLSLSHGGNGVRPILNPYPPEFNLRLKLKIRTRDNFTCCLCGKTEREELEELNRILCVNHIDFDKNNCKLKNLNTLCLKCNVRINREREYWTNHFQQL